MGQENCGALGRVQASRSTPRICSQYPRRGRRFRMAHALYQTISAPSRSILVGVRRIAGYYSHYVRCKSWPSLTAPKMSG
jgi:hypothetical protein